jgi:transcriptional regulator with XRE-family HTH domain
MNTAQALKTIRERNNLTQDVMAEKLFVTRQAVSKGETGESIPSTDTLKLISKEFGVSIDDLLGSDRNKICQSCSYPLDNTDELGTNADGTWNTDYCIYCYKDGEWVDPNQTVQGIIDYTVPFMTSPSMTADEARELLDKWIPTLKRWKQDQI